MKPSKVAGISVGDMVEIELVLPAMVVGTWNGDELSDVRVFLQHTGQDQEVTRLIPASVLEEIENQYYEDGIENCGVDEAVDKQRDEDLH